MVEVQGQLAGRHVGCIGAPHSSALSARPKSRMPVAMSLRIAARAVRTSSTSKVSRSSYPQPETEIVTVSMVDVAELDVPEVR